jgi:cysteine desulfurase
MNRIYLDHASATPLIKEARDAMRRAEKYFGNPSAPHTEGRDARALIEGARKSIARILSVKAHEVTFTSGATEANALAILGHVDALHKKGRRYEEMEVLFLEIEHKSILNLRMPLETRGVSVREIPVKDDGRINLEVFEKLLGEKTVLVSVGLVNSEIGIIEPLRKIKSLMEKETPHAVLHTDAAQVPRVLSIELSAYQADMMTLDALKIGGGPGAGALVHRHQIPLLPMVEGGGQESGLRGGTENVAQIVAFQAALEDASTMREKRVAAWSALQDYLFERLVSDFHDVVVNGGREYRSPGNVNVSFLEHDTEYLATLLDTHGVSVSTTSACDSSGGISHVVSALEKGSFARAKQTLRISFGPETKKRDLDRFLVLLHRLLPLTKL